MTHHPLLSLSLLILFSSMSTAQGGIAGVMTVQVERTRPSNRTWVVDAGGGGDFTDLQLAIDTVRSGDVLLLRSDIVMAESIVIQRKALTLVGDGARAQISREATPLSALLVIRDLRADQTVVLRNLRLSASFFDFGPPLSAFQFDDNAGSIWIEDCILSYPGDIAFIHIGWNGVRASNCSSLTLIRSFVGGGGGNLSNDRKAFEAIDSTIHLYETSIQGSSGGWLGSGVWEGGRAVELTNSFLFAAQSELIGGRGGPCVCSNQTMHRGGAGLFSDAPSVVHLVGMTVEGGANGFVVNPNCPGGTSCANPTPVGDIVGDGAVETLPGTLRTYELDAVATAGSDLTLTATGPEGELLLSLISDAPASTYLPLHEGVQLVAAPLQIVIEGTIPASGTLTKTISIPPSPLTIPALQTFQQGFFFTPSGDAFLSGGSSTLVLH